MAILEQKIGTLIINFFMKILELLLFPHHGSGSGSYVRNLSQTLSMRDHKIAICCPDTRPINSVKIYPISLPFMAAFTGHPEHPEAKLYSQLTHFELNDIYNAFHNQIINAVEDFQPDIVHVHHASLLSWIANYIKAVYQIHFIVTVHNTDILNAILDQRYIPLTQDALYRADFITAVSPYTQDRLLKILGKGYNFSNKTRIIGNGIDTKSFSSKGSVKHINKKYHLEGKKVVLFTGKLIPLKGVDILIKAAKKIDAEIFIIGEGKIRPDLENLTKSLKINNVHFLGYFNFDQRKEMSQFYRRADVFVSPSVDIEGLPSTVLEAMASGTPVVATDIGGTIMAVQEGVTGLLCKPKSIRGLTHCINTILENEEMRDSMGKAAREVAIKNFDWQVIAKQYDKLFEKSYTYSLKRRSSKKAAFLEKEDFEKGKKHLQILKKGKDS